MSDVENQPTTEELRAANAQSAINVLVDLAGALGGAGQFDAAGRAAAGAQAIKVVYGWYQAAQAQVPKDQAAQPADVAAPVQGTSS